MADVQNAQFKFMEYKIPQFFYNASEDPTTHIKIELMPGGTYDEKKGVFLLELFFTGKEDKEKGKTVVEVKSIATFKFDEGLPISSIPDFFYVNAIAIFFPYLRAFISTMTLQSNSPMVLLNIMNLTSLESPLKQNTKSVS